VRYSIGMNAVATTNEADILSRVIAPEEPTLPPDTARIILTFDFGKEDRDRMNLLAEKAREGTLTAEEQAEIDCYERVGYFLSLLRSKARISLKQANISS
jgi:uncharacterized protein YnzC (UPF0291/DUF896 family)